MGPRLATLGALLIGAAVTSHARADDDETVRQELQRVDFEAPQSCATAEVFLDEVRSRTPRLKLTHDDAWSTRFEVVVKDEGQRYVGALTVHNRQKSSERREVTARSCEEVLETLSLIVAVAIDPQASLTRRAKKPEPPAPVAQSTAAPTVAPTPAIDRPVEPVTAPEVVQPKPTWLGAVALGAEARSAFASDVALAGSLSFELERRMPTAWGWSLRASALRSLQSQVRDPFEREAHFRWTAGRLDGGLWLHAGRAASLQGGLGLDVGAIEAESVLSKTRAWVSALALFRARWWPAPPLSLEATAGAFAPLTRDRFVLFDPDTVVYRERALLGFLSVGVGLRIH